jgi:hypothetical protein
MKPSASTDRVEQLEVKPANESKLVVAKLRLSLRGKVWEVPMPCDESIG